MIKVVASVTVDIIGDGRTNSATFHVKQMRTPAPFAEGTLPTGLAGVKMAGGGGGVTGTLDDGVVTLTFAIPPSSAKITIDFLYGSGN